MVEVAQKPFSDSFGNYLLHGMEEIFLGEPISWWPQTTAWKVLAVLLVVLMVRWIYRKWQRWRENAYRREAIREIVRLKELGEVGALSEVLPRALKATALRAYPRSDVAQLTGKAWLRDLDARCSRTLFTSELGELLLRLSYEPNEPRSIIESEFEALVAMVITWIRHHDDGHATLAGENRR